MKDAAGPLADPIPPVDEHDDRPSVKALIDEHHALIGQVESLLAADPLFEAAKHDQLWILRFLLSHKMDAKLALAAAKSTLAFRREHRLDEKDIRFHPVCKNHENEAVRKHQEFCADGSIKFVVPDTKRGVVGFLHFAGIDQHSMVKHVDKSVWLPSLCYISEWSFQWVDYVTRTTGRLTKSVRLLDTRGFAMKMICCKCLCKRPSPAPSFDPSVLQFRMEGRAPLHLLPRPQLFAMPHPLSSDFGCI